jgi:hypothetical protein
VLPADVSLSEIAFGAMLLIVTVSLWLLACQQEARLDAEYEIERRAQVAEDEAELAWRRAQRKASLQLLYDSLPPLTPAEVDDILTAPCYEDTRGGRWCE